MTFTDWSVNIAGLRGRGAGPTGPKGDTGAQGSQGAQGISGPQGSNAYTTTTAPFTVPPVGQTVSVTLADASWITIGQIVWVQTAGGSGNAGALRVTAKAGNTVTLLNQEGGPAGIPDAVDSKTYVRRYGAWVELTIPVVFPFAGKPLASAKVVVPMAIGLIIPANLTGSTGYTTVNSTGSPVFTVNKLATDGTATTIGSITFSAGVRAAAAAGAGGSLAIGEALQLVAPASPDATLADLGISILAARA